MTHRKKWMAVTLAALAVSSLAIGLAGLFLLHASLLKTAAEQRDLVQENLSSRLEKQLAYFSGTADFLFGSNEDFIRRFGEKFSIHYTTEEGAAHTWDFWDRQIEKVLAWLNVPEAE